MDWGTTDGLGGKTIVSLLLILHMRWWSDIQLKITVKQSEREANVAERRDGIEKYSCISSA